MCILDNQYGSGLLDLVRLQIARGIGQVNVIMDYNDLLKRVRAIPGVPDASILHN